MRPRTRWSSASCRGTSSVGGSTPPRPGPSRKPRVLARLRRVLNDTDDAKASVLVLTECGAAEAAELATDLGLKHVTYLFTSVLYSAAWSLGSTWRIENNPGTHGTLIAELSREGRTVNVVASHFPPGISRAAKRKRLAGRAAPEGEGLERPDHLGR